MGAGRELSRPGLVPALILLSCLLAAPLAAEEGAGPAAEAASAGAGAAAEAATAPSSGPAEASSTAAEGEARLVPASDVLPAAYRAERKPPENFFRRFEIIAFGSYPITLLYTNFCFGLAGFASHDFDMSYAPWPFNSSSADTTSAEEHFLRMGVAACASLAVAGIDAVIRAVEEGKAEKGELDSGVGPH